MYSKTDGRFPWNKKKKNGRNSKNRELWNFFTTENCVWWIFTIKCDYSPNRWWRLKYFLFNFAFIVCCLSINRSSLGAPTRRHTHNNITFYLRSFCSPLWSCEIGRTVADEKMINYILLYARNVWFICTRTEVPLYIILYILPTCSG